VVLEVWNQTSFEESRNAHSEVRMADPIKPVMTPEEWDTVCALEQDVASLDAVTFLEIVLGPEPDPAAAAAALLYDRAVGFTWAMVDAIRISADRSTGVQKDGIGDVGETALAAAERLAALLPPRDGEV
jgi:hypothetical protein